jgi:hypothetical protein
VTLYLDGSGSVEYIFVGGGGDATAAVVVYEDRSGAGFESWPAERPVTPFTKMAYPPR